MAAAGILAVPLVAAAVAFACSPNASIAVSSPAGVAGSTVTVFGSAFDRVTEPVQLSVAGRSLGTTTAASFSMPVTIPDLPPAVYYVTATGRVGEDVYTHSAAFEVTGSPAVAASPGGGGPPGSNSPAGSGDGPSGGGPATSSEPASGQAPPAATKAPKAQPRTQRADTTRRGTRTRRNGSGGARERTAASVAQPPAAVQTASGQRVFAASVPPPRRAATPRSDGRKRVADRAASPATAERAPAGRPTGPSLLTGTVDEMQSSGPGSSLAVGMGLLGAGLVLMMGGFVVVEARRRRAPARGDSR